jgi:hypothetical protein
MPDTPIALSDEQLNAILTACHPLERHARELRWCRVGRRSPSSLTGEGPKPLTA